MNINSHYDVVGNQYRGKAISPLKPIIILHDLSIRTFARRVGFLLAHNLNMKPDVLIKVRFKTTAEGGRQSPIVIAEKPYGCVLFVDGEAFDCRLLVNAQTLHLGETYKLPVKLLNPDLVLPKLSPGKAVKLWEGKDIAIGAVVGIVWPTVQPPPV